MISNFHPLISIGLPVVNAKYLESAINCCIKQTFINIEILVQNNAKNIQDKVKIKEIVSSFCDDRITYVENNDQIPMIKNWNKTLSRANGEFFAILCDDDIWHPDFLKELIFLSHKFPKANIFHSRVITIDDQNNQIDISSLCPDFEDGLDFIYHRILGFRQIYLSDFMVRTNKLRSIGGFTELPDGWGSDDITWFKLAMEGGVGYSSKELFYYRNSSTNTTNNNTIRNKLLAIDLQYNEINKIISNDPNFSLKRRLIEKQLIFFKSSKKYPHWVKLLNRKFHVPYFLAVLISKLYKNYIHWKNSIRYKKGRIK